MACSQNEVFAAIDKCRFFLGKSTPEHENNIIFLLGDCFNYIIGE
jgi:hypothetical protein